MEIDTEMRDAELSDADDSLASTVESEPQEEYEVERILFEDEDNGLYLLKWAGYPESRATWEGPDSFQNLGETMNDWKQTKREIRQGLRDPFDVDKWDREQKRLQRNKERRQRTRRIKRAQRAKRRLERLKRSDPDLLNLFSADSDKEPSNLGDGDNAQVVHVPRVIDRPNTRLGRLKLFSNDDDDSDSDEEPFLPRGDANAQEVYAASDLISEHGSRPASVCSVSSGGSLFVSQDVAPAASTMASRATQGAIETHAIQLDREVEGQLSRSPLRRTRSRSGKRPGNDQHKNAPLIEALKPQEHPPQQPTQPDQTQQRQKLHHAQISHQPSAQPAQRMHQERTKQQQPLPPHPQPSATAPLPPLSSSSEERPAPSAFGTAPKPARTVRPRILRNDWTPDVNDLELLKPSDYSARGAGADSAALTMIRSTAKSQSSASPGNKAKEPMPKASSTAGNSTLISTGPRPVNPRIPEAKRSNRPARATQLDDTPVPRSRYDSWRPDREGPPRRVTDTTPYLYGGGDRYRPNSSRTWELRGRPDEGSPRGQMKDLPHRRRSRSHSRSRSPQPIANRSSATSFMDSSRPSAPTRPASFHVKSNPDPIAQRAPPFQTRLVPTRAEMTAEDHIAEMPVGKFEGKERGGRMVQGGYFWNQGEVLVHVYFGPGKDFVGVVRLCGLTSVLRSELLASKRATGSGVQTEMWFKEVCTKSQYDALCDQTPYNDLSGNAWMEGFHDSNHDLFHMTEYLRAQNSVAIYRPSKQWGFVWLLYSRRSTHITSSLNYDSDRVPAGVPAFLAARPRLPLLLDLERPRPTDEVSRGRRDFPSNVQFRGDHPMRRASLGALSIPRNDAVGNQPGEPAKGTMSANQSPATGASDSNLFQELQSSESRIAEQSLSSPMDPRLRRRASVSGGVPRSPLSHQPAKRHCSTNNERMSRPNVDDGQLKWVRDDFGGIDLMDTSPDVPAGPDPTKMPSSIGTAKKDMTEVFRTAYKITLEKLSTVSEGTGSGVYSPAHNFYLHPCAETDDESKQDRERLQTWLETFPQIKIFSDWGEFLRTSRGVIMFHESFTLYENLRPEIRGPLWSSRYKFWNYRLSKPLQVADPFYCGKGTHFEPIFTVGHSLLFTEDIFDDLKRALSLIMWFYNMIFISHRVLNYKLMLPPGIMQYLDSRLDKTDLSEEDTKILMFIKSWIHKINTVDPDCKVFQPQSLNPLQTHLRNNNIVSFAPGLIPKWGHRNEEDNPEIPKGLSQDERNMDHLVELFTAWTLLRKADNRKTVVITDSKLQILHRRWENWGHVTLFSPNNFMKTFNIDKEAFLAKALGEERRDDDGRLRPGTTPKTPVLDPRTPRPPWENQTGDGASSPNERRPRNYPASLGNRTADETSSPNERRRHYPAPYE